MPVQHIEIVLILMIMFFYSFLLINFFQNLQNYLDLSKLIDKSSYNLVLFCYTSIYSYNDSYILCKLPSDEITISGSRDIFIATKSGGFRINSSNIKPAIGFAIGNFYFSTKEDIITIRT